MRVPEDDDADRRVLPGADRRLLRVRRPVAHAVAGLRRRPGGPRSSSTTSSRSRSRPRRRVRRRRPDDRRDLRRRRRGARTVRGDPVLTARVGVAASRRRPRARDRAALPGAHRAAAAPLLRRRGRRAARPVRAPRTLGRPRNAPSCGSTAPRWCRGSPAPPRSRCRWSAPTTSRSPPPKYLHALRDGDGAAAVPVQRNDFRPGGPRVLGRSRCRGTARIATTCRSRYGAT